MSDDSLEEEVKKNKEIEGDNNNKNNNNNKKFNIKPINERETSRFLTKFERAKVLGERAIK